MLRRGGKPLSKRVESPELDRPEDTDWNWGETYTAQVCHTKAPWGYTAHLKVRRHDGLDGISWDILQRIKDDMLGEDVLAIEVYPPRRHLVNQANIRHLWAVPLDHMPFGLHGYVLAP